MNSARPASLWTGQFCPKICRRLLANAYASVTMKPLVHCMACGSWTRQRKSLAESINSSPCVAGVVPFEVRSLVTRYAPPQSFLFVETARCFAGPAVTKALVRVPGGSLSLDLDRLCRRSAAYWHFRRAVARPRRDSLEHAGRSQPGSKRQRSTHSLRLAGDYTEQHGDRPGQDRPQRRFPRGGSRR